ncbi:MAG: hypothetical protein IJF05_04765 [Clostridia bacterium]|nr:hypothetical protein [Clostridia bacterium]
MEIFSIIIQFFDFLISSFVSLYNIVRYLWREILLGALILALALFVIRVFLAAKKQRAFIKAVRTSAKENGIKIRFARPPFLCLLFNFDGYDMEMEIGGKKYRIKLCPFITSGLGVHLSTATEAVYLGRLATRRALSKGKVSGISVRLKYDPTPAESTVNVLVLSPTPLAVTERRENGTVWELDTDNGQDIGGVLVFTDAILISRLPRLMDGYIDSLIHYDE